MPQDIIDTVQARQPTPPDHSVAQSDTGDSSDSAWLDFSPPDDWRGIPNHFNQGLTSGTYDEISAATEASIDAGYDHAFGDPGEQGFTDQRDQIYTQKQKAHQDWLDDYARRNPKSAMAADLVGAIVQAGLTGGVSALWKSKHPRRREVRCSPCEGGQRRRWKAGKGALPSHGCRCYVWRDCRCRICQAG